MYDGEGVLFLQCQKEYNILGREKNFILLSSVTETSEKVSIFYFFYYFGGDFLLSHLLGGAGQLCLGFGPKVSLICKTVLAMSLE